MHHKHQRHKKYFYKEGHLGSQEEKAWFATGVYDYFLVERDILQLTI